MLLAPYLFFSFRKKKPVVFLPNSPGGKDCEPSNRMSSFGYLSFVLSLINSVVNAANNVNANQNNNNNNNNNNNDNNNNVVGGEKRNMRTILINVLQYQNINRLHLSKFWSDFLKHFKQTSDILRLQIARSRFMGSCSEHISFLECGKFEHQSEQWQHGDSRPSKAEVRTKRKGTSKNTQGSCPTPFVS